MECLYRTVFVVVVGNGVFSSLPYEVVHTLLSTMMSVSCAVLFVSVGLSFYTGVSVR